EENVPILLVNRPLSWRIGGGQFVITAFETLGDKKFALAFDGYRLWESILFLLNSYAIQGYSPIFPAQNFSIDKQGDNSVFLIEMLNGNSLAFDLTDEMREKLKKLL